MTSSDTVSMFTRGAGGARTFGGRIRVSARKPDHRDDRLTLAVRRARRGG
ncbi:MAG TPA: hypothetical protein VGJ32_14645 [Solirubrobacteraceae bacterium]|jgi:hypothetical protein